MIGAAVGGLVVVILIGLGIWFYLSGRSQSEDDPRVVANLECNVLHGGFDEGAKGSPPPYEKAPGLQNPMPHTHDENAVVVDMPAATNTNVQVLKC